MSNRFNSDEEMMAQWVREAGDPSVSPDPRYIETLRATILDRVGPAKTVAPVAEDAVTEFTQPEPSIPSPIKRNRNMKRIANLVMAASVLVALGSLVSWLVIGGGATKIAFADVAKALDNLRTATYDTTTETKNADGTWSTTTMKGFFFAPSRERVEMSVSTGMDKEKSNSILISDHEAKKSITLAPELKLATTIDLAKLEKPSGPSNPFAMVQQLVREGSSGLDEKVESLGEKVFDGRVVVGFRIQSNMANQTFWADPKTARPVRVEFDYPNDGGHGLISNFRYDIELDASLFSLDPPAGYTVNNMDMKMPLERDLVDTLRLIAEHNDGTFPTSIGMTNKEFQQASQAAAKSASEEFIKTPATQKRREELKAQYGEDTTGYMKAWAKEIMPFSQKIAQKNMQGMFFYSMLTSKNDSHYIGKNVKLDTPNRPIFWYKPTGSDLYRVINADLSVKEMTAAEVKQLPIAKTK